MNEEDLKLLAGKLQATKDAKWYRRLKIIQLSSLGDTVSKLSKSVSEKPIYAALADWLLCDKRLIIRRTIAA